MKISINIIFTFKNKEQLTTDIFIENNILQFDYINYIFSLLNKNELTDLIKISNCQDTNKAKCILWLYYQSKYYFEADTDIFWHQYKTCYINKKTSLVFYIVRGKEFMTKCSYDIKKDPIINIQMVLNQKYDLHMIVNLKTINNFKDLCEYIKSYIGKKDYKSIKYIICFMVYSNEKSVEWLENKYNKKIKLC